MKNRFIEKLIKTGWVIVSENTYRLCLTKQNLFINISQYNRVCIYVEKESFTVYPTQKRIHFFGVIKSVILFNKIIKCINDLSGHGI